MRERLRAHAALAVVLTTVVAAPTALGYSNGGGRSEEAPGQVQARQQCDNVTSSQQISHGHGGGHAGYGGPANCDHFYNR